MNQRKTLATIIPAVLAALIGLSLDEREAGAQGTCPATYACSGANDISLQGVSSQGGIGTQGYAYGATGTDSEVGVNGCAGTSTCGTPGFTNPVGVFGVVSSSSGYGVYALRDPLTFSFVLAEVRDA